MQEWINEGYPNYLKRRKRKDSKALFCKHLHKSFKEKGIDTKMISSGQETAKELFWQVHCLRKTLGEVLSLVAKSAIASVEIKNHAFKRIEKMEEVHKKISKVFKEKI